MKKPSISLAALSLAILTIAVIASCGKEKSPKIQAAPQTLQAKEAIGRIRNFRRQIKEHQANPQARSTGKVSLEDAMWDLENVFNVTYAHPEVPCLAKAEFEFSLYITVDTDGEVLVCDLLDLYADAVTAARVAYTATETGDKVFRYLTVETDGVDEGRARLVFKGRTGERGSDPWPYSHDSVVYYGPFSDDYHYDYGKCDGTGIDGADEMLTYHVGWYIASLTTAPPAGTRTIYVNTLLLPIYGYDYPNDLFYRTNVSATCIDFNNMNRLYRSEGKLVTQTLPGDPYSGVYGMTPIDFTAIAHNTTQFIYHDNEVTYAQRLTADLDDVGEPLDLLDE